MLLYGGTFDPIHYGHLRIAPAAAAAFSIPRMVLLPSRQSPHKLDGRPAAAEDRLAMCRAAVADDVRFEVSDWELCRPPPSYSLHTVRHFQGEHPAARLYWLIGMDGLRELHLWHRIAELADEVTFLTALRPGYAAPEWAPLAAVLRAEQVARLRAHVWQGPQVDISATEVRRRAAAGLPLAGLVPPAVAEIIAARGLYQTEPQPK